MPEFNEKQAAWFLDPAGGITRCAIEKIYPDESTADVRFDCGLSSPAGRCLSLRELFPSYEKAFAVLMT